MFELILNIFLQLFIISAWILHVICMARLSWSTSFFISPKFWLLFRRHPRWQLFKNMPIGLKSCKKMFRASSNTYLTNENFLDWLFDILFFLWSWTQNLVQNFARSRRIPAWKAHFALILPFFWRHPRWQLHANMPIGHKKLQENVQSQFKHLSNERKKFGLIIRHTLFSMIMNSKLDT